MYGAIIGDIVGSVYEFDNVKTKDFPFLTDKCTFTDDTILTIAVARALLRYREECPYPKSDLKELLVKSVRELCLKYPSPKGGYGLRFLNWLYTNSTEPYNSFGNGSAMRVSACGLIATSMEQALLFAKYSSEITHNHPEGVKGAQAVAGAIFMAKRASTKETIKRFIEDYFYDLDFCLDDIRDTYEFNESCQGTVPQAIVAFLESTDYEDAIRNAVSLGGDSDTLAAITGSIAWAYYKNSSEETLKRLQSYVSEQQKKGEWPVSKAVLDSAIKYPFSNDVISYVNDLLPEDFLETINAVEEYKSTRIKNPEYFIELQKISRDLQEANNIRKKDKVSN